MKSFTEQMKIETQESLSYQRNPKYKKKSDLKG